MRRVFLFLQGPHGPFLRELGLVLARAGHGVLRVNLTGGDWIDWHGPGTIAWRGRPEGFAPWLEALARREGVSDLVLYGDCRPPHQAAITRLGPLGIRVHVLEEGYVRPDWVTLERGGVNAHSRLRRDPVHLLRRSGQLEHLLPNSRPTGAGTRAMVLWCLRHHAAALLGRPFFRHYRGHRPEPLQRELLGWCRRLAARPARSHAASRLLARLARSDAPVFLLPLQLDADAQIRHHSPFAGMAEVIELVAHSFARHAPADAILVVKNHPLDNGVVDRARLVRAVAARTGLGPRLAFLEGGRLPALLERVAGVVVVNSTVGLQAIHHGRPTRVLGRALYDIPGLTDRQPLARFWHDPVPPDPLLYRAFRTVLMAETQLNGGFYTRTGRALLLAAAAARLCAADVVPLAPPTPTRTAPAEPLRQPLRARHG